MIAATGLSELDDATFFALEAELDAISQRANDEKWRLSRRRQVDAAVRLIRFSPDHDVDYCRRAVERELAEFEGFDAFWRTSVQPATKASKHAAMRLANALSKHVEPAMKNPNLALEFRWHGRELIDLRLRAERAANEKIGSKRGRGQREAFKRRDAIQTANNLMRFSRSDADKFSRFVKLANVIYSGKAEETANFKRLCKPLSQSRDYSPDRLARIIKQLGLK
jgi:hypothetical protein